MTLPLPVVVVGLIGLAATVLMTLVMCYLVWSTLSDDQHQPGGRGEEVEPPKPT